MIRIFFTTIWNNRRRNILVFIELFIISLFLFNLTVYLVNMITIFRIKNCYDIHNIVAVRFRVKNDEEKNISEQSFRNLKLKLSSDPLVESVSLSTFAVPYNYSLHGTDFIYENNQFFLALRPVDIDYASVMKITPLKGRWFDETDIGKSVSPVIISKDIDEKYFGGNAIGKIVEERTSFPDDIATGENYHEIIGVVNHFKRSDTEKPISFAFILEDKTRDSFWGGVGILIRTVEGKTGDILATVESQVYSTLDPEVWTVRSLNLLENMRNNQNYEYSQQRYLSLIIVLFIMINVFLGVIGILWYNTNLRIHEIGIKRAVGATGAGIKRLLLAENMFLAGLALLMVILIFIQIPTFIGDEQVEPGVFIKSIWISVITMIILVILSTWIPASIVSKKHPATALKTE